MTGSISQDAPTLAAAAALDAADELAPLRRRFSLPEGVLYFDGNSLGALPSSVPARLREVVEEEWGGGLIHSWFEGGWWDAPLRVGGLIEQIAGCAEGQIVVGDSVSVQVFNLLTAGARLNPGRSTILIDAEVFPTDAYIASSVARLLGCELRPVPMADLPAELAARGDDVAVVLASAVDFRSGELWDVEKITSACHEQGAVVLWDLCHAIGAVPLDLDGAGVDLAVGCTYKYLSGGPGAPAFAYVASRHQGAIDLPLTGWHGHEHPFDFATAYVAAGDVSRARIGTPHILSMLALEEALGVFAGVSLDCIRQKNIALGDFFFACLDAARIPGVECVTPREGARRGSHLALTHPRSGEVMSALRQRGVICDHRPPNLLRFGYNSLYISFKDIFLAVDAIAEAIGALG